MATIQPRKNQDGTTSYRVQVRLKGHPTQSATFARKTDAKRWAAMTETAIREGRHFKTTEAKRHTGADMIERYKVQVMPHKRPRTQSPQYAQLTWWNDEIGDYLLADITPALLSQCRDKLSRRGCSPATVVRYLAVLSHAFTVAMKEWQWVESNPLYRVTRPKEPRGRVRFLDNLERERLLTACRESSNPDLYTAVILALSTGCRRGELMTLTWDQVDLERGAITLHETKNGERRTLPLAGSALELMQARKSARYLVTPLVFPSRVHPHLPVDLRQPWEAALKRAEITDFRWHDLRHTAASYLAMSGASLAEIAEVLGHRTLSMVKRYTHLSHDHTAAVVARMNRQYLGD